MRARQELLADTARFLGLPVGLRFVAIPEGSTVVSPLLIASDLALIDDSRAIIVCLSPDRALTAYRSSLLRASVDTQRYVCVIPDATVLLLETLDVDYVQLRERCEDVALALLLGQHAVVTSYSFTSTGQESAHELRLTLGGFERVPVTSSGLISRGTWGNLPGGETFIAPLEGSANGSFALNAFAGCVLDRASPIAVEFRNGLLAHVAGTAPERRNLVRLFDSHHGNDHSIALAELGIGLNGAIRQLTGKAVFDEKMAGTVHIGVGDNSNFGGTLKSSFHEDLIALAPSLAIDGKPLVERGQYVLNHRDWQEGAADAMVLGAQLPSVFNLTKTITHASRATNGRLRVRREVGAQRECTYTMGSDEISADLAEIYDTLPATPQEISLSIFAGRLAQRGWQAPTTYLRGLIAILEKHGLVTLDQNS